MPELKELIEEVEPVDGEEDLHSFLTELREHRFLPVETDGEVQGVITVDSVARRGHPPKTKAKKIAQNISRIGPDGNVVEIAGKMVREKHDALPVFSGDEYLGLVTEMSMLGAVADDQKGKKMEDIMNEPFTISRDATVGKARATMRDKRVSKLPVVDDEGDLIGVVDWINFLSLDRPKEAMQRGDRGGDAIQDSDIGVSSVTDRDPLVVDRNADISEVARKMMESNSPYALAMTGKKPSGIVTCEDLLEFLAAQAPEKGVYVQITGADDLGPFEEEKLHSHIEESIQKIGRIYKGLEYFYLHIKHYEKSGTRTKYSIRTRLMTPVGTFRSESYDYDLATAVDEAMDRLERIVKEDHEKRRDQRRKRSRDQLE